MQIVGRTDDGRQVLATMSDQEALLWGCLEDAWNDVVTEDGPPGKLWYQNVDLSPAMRGAAALAELLTRSNGLRSVLDSLDTMLRKGEPKADGLPRLAWKETEAYKIMRGSEPALRLALANSYSFGEFDGTRHELSLIASGVRYVSEMDDAGRKAIGEALENYEEQKGDAATRLAWKETEAYKIMRGSEPALLNVLSRDYFVREFDGTRQGLALIASGKLKVSGVGDFCRLAILASLGDYEERSSWGT